MELRSPDAAPFFLGLHHIRIFGSLHRRDLGCHFSGLGTGQKHRQQGKQHGPKEDHRRSAEASELAKRLMDKLEETKVFVGTKQTDYEYKHRECLAEIHAIDDYINEQFGLTKNESEYIKGYALRYRTSGGAKIE